MKEAWRPLLYADEDQQAKRTRDPIAAAIRSKEALKKAASKKLPCGQAVHSFQTKLSAIVRNKCRSAATKEGEHFVMETPPTQSQALELLQRITL